MAVPSTAVRPEATDSAATTTPSGRPEVDFAGGDHGGPPRRGWSRPSQWIATAIKASKSAQRARLARYLAPHAAFAGCRRATMQRIAEWGELVDVEPGVALVREDHGDFWFFVLLEGQVKLSRGGADLAVLGPGSHFGQHAIVGLRPQPATATTVDTCRVFILGPRYVVSVLETSKPFRRSLFPDVDPDDYRAFSRRMHAEGRTEWHRLTPPPSAAPGGLGHVVVHRPARPATPAGPTASWRTSMPGGALGRRIDVPPAAPVVLPMWLRLAVAALAALAVAAAGLWYHPPRAVITAGRPIDVMADIRINGAAPRPTGSHYLLLWVRTSRPNLARYVIDVVHGDTTVAVTGPTSPAKDRAAVRDGRKAYLDSQRTAVAAAAAMAGLDPGHVSVSIRDRGFVGPSGGLVYALALTDLLRGTDSTGGRVVAATGALDADGHVEGVGWVPVKAHGASRAGATMLLVPEEDQALAYGAAPVVIGVTSLRQAEEALARRH